MQLRSLNVAPMRVAGARALELHQLLPSCLCWTPVLYDALRPYCTGYVKCLAGHAHELQVACWFGCCLLVPAISRYLEDCFPLYPPDGFGMFGGTCFNEIKPVSAHGKAALTTAVRQVIGTNYSWKGLSMMPPGTHGLGRQ